MLRFTFIFSFQRAFCRPAGAARPGAAPGARLRAGPGRGRQRFASEGGRTTLCVIGSPAGRDGRCRSRAAGCGAVCERQVGSRGPRGAGGGVPGGERCETRGKTQTFTRRHRGMRSALLEESIVLEGGDLRGKGHLEPREHLFFFLLFLHAVRGAGRYGALLRHPSSPLALKQRYCGQCSAACLFVPLAVPLAGLRTCSPGAAIVRCC